MLADRQGIEHQSRVSALYEFSIASARVLPVICQKRPLLQPKRTDSDPYIEPWLSSTDSLASGCNRDPYAADDDANS
jgi:hypothetical protein